MNGTYQQGHIQILSRGGCQLKRDLWCQYGSTMKPSLGGTQAKLKKEGLRGHLDNLRSLPLLLSDLTVQANSVTFMANISE